MPILRWKKTANWSLSTTEQVIWTADGQHVQYKVTRAGTADKPRWALYTRTPDEVEECRLISNRLSDAKSIAARLESRT